MTAVSMKTRTGASATLPSDAIDALRGRLAKIKTKYDKDNLFRQNQNIVPAA